MATDGPDPRQSPVRAAASSAAPTLRNRLILLVAGVALPFMVLTAMVIWTSYRDDRARAEERLQEQAHALALAVDREVGQITSVLTTLAASPTLARGDLVAFEGYARAASVILHGAPVLLIDRSGREVLSTGWDFGNRRADRMAPAMLLDCLTSGQPAISNLYKGNSGRRRIAIGVPVAPSDAGQQGAAAAAYVIATAMPPGVFGAVLAEQRLPDGWVGGVVDRADIVVARSSLSDLYVGTQAIPAARAAFASAEAGVFHAVRADGVPSSFAFARARDSRFVLTLGVPDDILVAPLRVGLWRTLTVGLLATGCGLGLALYTGRDIAAGIQGLASGRPAVAPRGREALREVQEVAARLARIRAERDAAEESLRALASRLEDEVAARTAALAESEARQRAIFDAQFQFITLLTPDGTRIEMNAAALAFGGRPASEVIGRKLWDVPWWSGDPARSARLQNAVARAAAGEFVRFESESVRADGSPVVMDFSLKPIFDVSGRTVIMLIGEGRDTTELRRLETRLAQANRLEALGQLAGGIAHDFNNVLQAVSGGVALILRRAEDPAAVARLARTVAEAAERGSSITRRLLGFARRDELRAAPVDVAALLANLREVLGYTLGAGVVVEVAAPDGLAPVLADRGQLETVLVNLATNARDAMPEGGTLTLAAEAETVDGDAREGQPASLSPGCYIRLSARDTGQGMDAATLARATEPFFTTKDVGKGTGLGLSMARGFAEQSGGALEIASAPSAGTTVTLWLPQSDSAERPAAAPASVAPREAARVLLVEDDTLVRDVLAADMSELGYRLDVATDGPAALALLDGGAAVDLLVTDLSMPGMSGIDLIRAAQARRPGLPAILLTGYAGEAASLAVGAALQGTFTLLRKPVTGAQLADRIAAVLERPS